MTTPVVIMDGPGANAKQIAAALKGTLNRAAAVGATAGDAILISGVTTAGTVTLTLVGGGSVTVNVPLGSTILNFGATAVNLGSTGGTAQSLFYS